MLAHELKYKLKQSELNQLTLTLKCVHKPVCRKLKSIVHNWQICERKSNSNSNMNGQSEGITAQASRKPVWEEDYELIDNEGLFEECLEMGRLFSLMYFCVWMDSLENALLSFWQSPN